MTDVCGDVRRVARASRDMLRSDRAEVADKLVYSHETIHLQNKLQDAGWEAEVVAHESDSDSDEAASDEEKDLAEDIFSEETVLLLMQ